ncbi:MAG: extracellular solute-binding protein [Chloroflexi bacterium]|nr:extracellular solute-binding protein [Chloroflexota bacterium]
MTDKNISRRQLLKMAGLGMAGAVLAACQPKVVEKIVKETVVVKEMVKETVVVKEAVEVEKEVTRVVEKVAQPESPKPRTQPVELTIWFHWGGDRGLLAQALIDDFNNSVGVEKKIKVTIETTRDQEYRQKLTAVHMAGNPPDLYHLAISTMELVANSIIAPLPEEEQQFVRDYYILPGVDKVSFQGQVWGYPTEIQGPCLAYRRSWFEKAGIEVPQDMVQMREIAKELTHEEGGVKYYGFAIQYQNYPMRYHFPQNMRRCGGDMYTMRGDVPIAITVNSEPAIQAASWWDGMVEDGSTNVPEVPGWECMWNGLAAMMEVNPWVPIIQWRDKEGTPREVYEDCGFTAVKPWPGIEPVGHLAGSWMCVQDRLSKDLDAGWEVLKWMFHPPDMPFSRFIVEQIGAVPAPKNYPPKVPGWSDAMIQGYLVEAPKIGIPMPGTGKVLGAAEINTELQATLEAIVLQQADPKPALDELQPKVEEILKRTDGARW